MLLLIGSRGTVILQDDYVIGLANDFLAARRRLARSPWSASRSTRASSSTEPRVARKAGLRDRPDR